MRLQPQTYALTAVTYDRHRIFQRTENAVLFIETLLRYRDRRQFLLHGFVVMPDHTHTLLTPTESIEKATQLIKGGFSFSIRDRLPGKIWQPAYHAHRITDHEDYRNQLAYIANNPLCKDYRDYPHIHTHAAYSNQMDPTPPHLTA